MTGRGSDDHDHLARFDRLGGRCSYMGVDISDGDRNAFRQARPSSGPRSETAGPRPNLADAAVELVSREPAEARVQCCEEVFGRVRAVLVDPFVARGTRVSDI